MAFFNADKDFIKAKEHGSGNTALHMACRHGHFVSIVCKKSFKEKVSIHARENRLL